MIVLRARFVLEEAVLVLVIVGMVPGPVMGVVEGKEKSSNVMVQETVM